MRLMEKVLHSNHEIIAAILEKSVDVINRYIKNLIVLYGTLKTSNDSSKTIFKRNIFNIIIRKK